MPLATSGRGRIQALEGNEIEKGRVIIYAAIQTLRAPTLSLPCHEPQTTFNSPHDSLHGSKQALTT